MTTLRSYARNPLNRIRGAVASRTLATALARKLHARSTSSTEGVTGDGGVDVSMTTHGARLERVHIALQAISEGTVRPHSLTLWVDTDKDKWTAPRELQALVKRGLRIEFTENYGPHTKYFPHCMSNSSHSRPLVTADDDILYPRDWLSSLLNSAKQDSGAYVVAHRAHHIEFDSHGQIASYMDWTRQTDDRPSTRVFATGVSGVLYPPIMLNALRSAGDTFRSSAPRADDIWLHAMALRNGIAVRQALPAPRDFLSVPTTQVAGLGVGNAFGSGNDEQIRSTYSPEDLRLISLGRS